MTGIAPKKRPDCLPRELSAYGKKAFRMPEAGATGGTHLSPYYTMTCEESA
jgi:hypothetical protein